TTTINIAYSNDSKKKMSLYLKNNSANLVHVHNFFPLLTPSIYDACIEKNVPVVQTLHNYRTICPGALLMREGNICEKCVTGSPYQSVLFGCYRNSRIGTLSVARMVNYHRKCNTWNTKVNRFVVLTEFAKSKFVEAGFDSNKISVKPNFIPDPIRLDANLDERINSALFVGRISQEKGLTTLVKAWAKVNAAISIAGDGPLLNSLSSNSEAVGLRFLGSQDKEGISHLMLNSQFLVMPSECYEGFPMVLVEAFAHGLPVLASRLGGMAEIVEDGVTGVHFEVGNADDLAEKAQWMLDNPDECRRMGNNAREVYLEKYTPEKNHEILMDIYEEAITDLYQSTSCI
ncbi:MAG: glycosyltransferase family 4 protein, partial [Gammaproteobacteria bacterium]|nr:glycosyltransferase family 4 protein [Gammaproteobacteria bacterium]